MAESYQVTSQIPDLEMNQAGNGFDSGWKVSYKVTSGPAMNTTGSVFVTNDNHNAETVGALIEAKIDDLGRIAQLGS